MRRWTKEELKILRNKYFDNGSDIPELNRSRGVIRTKAMQLKIKCKFDGRYKKGLASHAKGTHVSLSTEFKKGHKPYFKSKKMYIKHSIFMKKNNPMFNPELREKCIKNALIASQKRPTETEKFMIDLIKKYDLSYKYVGNGSFLIGYKNPDFVNINGQKICIEVFYPYFKIRNYLNSVTLTKL